MGGGCNAGVCTPPPARFVVAAGGDLVGVALDASRVYFSSLANGMGSVQSVAKTGMSPATHWSGQGFGWWLGTGAGTLVFTLPAFNGVVRVDAGGGMPTALAVSQPGPQRLAIDATRACWANQGTQGAGYNNGSIVCALLPAGQPVAMAGNQGRPGGIALDGQYVYWTNRNSGTVVRLALGNPGGAPAIIAMGQASPIAVVVDAQLAYWANANGGIMRASLAGGVAPAPIVTGQTGIFDIALDNGNIYYTASFMAQGAGVVRRVHAGGGAPFTLAAGQSWPGAVVVDGTDVYWRAPNVGVMRTAK
jgi:hypothetical protein